MSRPRQDNATNEDDRLFDLLVDGELDEDRRGELLGGLDDRPGGWRKCALAFLQAQSWKQEFGTLGTRPQPQVVTTETAAAGAAMRPRRHLGRGSAILGMAASLLLGVGLTSLVRDLQRGGVNLGGPGMSANVMGGGANGASGSPFASGDLRRASPDGLHWVGLGGMGPDGTARLTALPAVPRERLDERWLENLAPAVPPEMTDAFRQAGHEVRPSRRLVPVSLPDGRRVVFPVDQLDVHYVGHSKYQ